MSLVTFNDHLDEFHNLKGVKPLKQLNDLLIALHQILHHRTLLSLPAEPEGAVHMQRCSDFNFFNAHPPALSKMHAALEASAQTHAKSPAAADSL